MPTNTYESPLSSRYASPEMLYIFSADKKFTTWRRLWIALARAEMELGLPITQAQIDEMEAHKDEINYTAAAQYERQLRHDVMAHIHAYGDLCPSAIEGRSSERPFFIFSAPSACWRGFPPFFPRHAPFSRLPVSPFCLMRSERSFRCY